MNTGASRLYFITLLIVLISLFRILGALGLLGNMAGPFHPSSRKDIFTHNVTQSDQHGKKTLILKTINLNNLRAAFERGDSRARVAIYILASGLIAWVIGSLWFAVEAFGVSIPWGLFVLLFNGLASLIFLVRHWERARIPLIVYLGGICMVIAGLTLA